jgi:hypothetical protein
MAERKRRNWSAAVELNVLSVAALLALLILGLAGCSSSPSSTRTTATTTPRVPRIQPVVSRSSDGLLTWSGLPDPTVADTPVGLYFTWVTSPLEQTPRRVVLARINPTTGRVQAERAIDAASMLGTADSLFVTTWSSNEELLLRLNPQTLAEISHWRISTGHEFAERNSDMAVARDGLWVAGGNRLVRISLPTGRLTATVNLPGADNSDVATDASGTELLVGVGERTNTVERRDPTTGTLLASRPISGIFTPAISGVMGADVWVSEPTGMMGTTELYDVTDLRPLGPPCDAATCPCNNSQSTATCIVGTNDVSAQVTNGRLWVTQGAGGPTRNFCGEVDGHVLAALPVPNESYVLAVGSRYLFVTDPQGLLADKGQAFSEVTLPAACGRS